MINPTFTFADLYLPYHPEKCCFIDLDPLDVEIDIDCPPEESYCCTIKIGTIFRLPLRLKDFKIISINKDERNSY